jgi:hypothetical protein
MSFKTTYVLFGVVAALFVVLAIAFWMEPTPTDASAWVLPSVQGGKPLSANDVDRVEIERDRPTRETLVFERNPETKRWRITQPRSLRADGGAVQNLIRQVLDAKRDLEADRPSSLKSWGLEPPAETVTLKKGDERTVWLQVGDVSPGKESAVIYVMSSDRPKEGMAVAKNTLDAVLKGINDFRDRDVLAASPSDVQMVKVSEGKKGPVELKKIDNRWRYVTPDYGAAESEGEPAPAADPNRAPNGMRVLLDDLTNLRVGYRSEKDNDFVEDDAKDLARYGLEDNNPNALRIEIERTESIDREAGKESKKTSKVVLLVGKKAEDKTEKKEGDKKEADKKEEKVYARLESEKNVVLLPARALEPIRKLLDDPEALRDRTLVRFDNFARPDAVNVKNATGLLEFRRNEQTLNPTKSWELWRGSEPGQNVDDQALTGPQGLVTVLTQKNVIRSFPDPKAKEADLGLDKPEVVVSFWVDGIAKDEKKDEKKDTKKDEKKDEKKEEKKDKKKKPKLKDENKPNVVVSFGKRENGLVAVKRQVGEEVLLARVPELLLDKAKEGALAYLSKDLPEFNAGASDASADVTGLELQRGGTTYVLTREGKDKPWKIEKPAELAGRTADANQVRFILGTLNRLRANKLIAEKPNEAQLDKEYGLKTPSTRAVVTVTHPDKKPEKFEYDFGKELEDKLNVYGKQSGRDVVFAVDKALLAPLQTGELLDLGVFNFDVAKVKAVKLTGWQNVVGSPLTLELERKDASQWTVKSPAAFNLDAAKVRSLLDALSHLRAERFISHKMGPKPEQELDVARGALVIEITVEGEKESLQLTIGKLDADKSYFATSNKLPGDVFQVSRAAFDGPKSKPAYFSP